LIAFVPLSPNSFYLKHGLLSNNSFKAVRKGIEKICNGEVIEKEDLEKSPLLKYLHDTGIIVEEDKDVNFHYKLLMEGKNDENKSPVNVNIAIYGTKYKDYMASRINAWANSSQFVMQINIFDAIKLKEKSNMLEEECLIIVSDNFNVEIFREINAFCLERNIKHIYIFSDGSHIFIIGWFIPFQTACFKDFELWLTTSHPSSVEAKSYLGVPHVSTSHPATVALLECIVWFVSFCKERAKKRTYSFI